MLHILNINSTIILQTVENALKKFPVYFDPIQKLKNPVNRNPGQW